MASVKSDNPDPPISNTVNVSGAAEYGNAITLVPLEPQQEQEQEGISPPVMHVATEPSRRVSPVQGTTPNATWRTTPTPGQFVHESSGLVTSALQDRPLELQQQKQQQLLEREPYRQEQLVHKDSYDNKKKNPIYHQHQHHNARENALPFLSESMVDDKINGVNDGDTWLSSSDIKEGEDIDVDVDIENPIINPHPSPPLAAVPGTGAAERVAPVTRVAAVETLHHGQHVLHAKLLDSNPTSSSPGSSIWDRSGMKGSKVFCFWMLLLIAGFAGLAAVGIACRSGAWGSNNDSSRAAAAGTTGTDITTRTDGGATIASINVTLLGTTFNAGVAEISFFKESLTGTLPTELGYLTSLASLDLSWNEISGTIPSNLGFLTRLTFFALCDNKFSGTIPSQLGLLTHLTWLCLHDNPLSGTVPSQLGLLTRLGQLNLFNSHLSGSIPSQLGLLTRLGQLNLFNSQLSGSIPSQFGLLTQLSWLNFQDNRLSGNIPSDLGLLTQLSGLFLSANQLSGTIPSELGLLTHLTWLSIDNNQLNGTIPSQLGLLTQLTSLRFGINQLSGTIPSELGLLTKLTLLDLFNNQLSSELPPTVCALKNLSINVDLTCPDDCGFYCGR